MINMLAYWKEFLWVAAAVLVGLGVHSLAFGIARHVVKRTDSVLGRSILKHSRGPSRLIVPLVIVNPVFELLELPSGTLLFLRQIFSIFLIGAVVWMIIKIVYVFEDVILGQFRSDVVDNLRARRIETQIRILKKVFIIALGILGLASVLMTFDRVRHLGASILTSAGILGIIVGLAAQRSIATLLAGIQIAITQPIRYDDVVIVENEWGRIEEITLTYVVVRIWDLRRLIVPITYFIEKPFENWTRTSAHLLGTVFLHVDYSTPIQAIREELQRIVENSKKWDGRVCGIQVTNATERTIEVRALTSAADSSSAWDLRCEVREKLIRFLQENIPGALPKLRAEIKEQESRGRDSEQEKGNAL